VKKVFIKTYGCQMNERDSEAVAALLRQRGYGIAGNEAEADAILLNTCSVRDLAEQKAIGKMHEFAYRKKRQPALVLGFMGCMAQSRGAELPMQVPGVDLVVGTQRFHHVVEHLDRLFAGGDAIVDIADEAGSERAIKDHVLGTNGDRQVSAFVSIMQGCDMACTFCIVPQTRGAERSRPIAEIVDEVRRLADAGVCEVTLLGQIVTSYGRKETGKRAFVELLDAVHTVPGIERIRFTAPHPKGFGDDLVDAYRRLPKLCEVAHLPLQSGSDRLLKVMQRGYTRDSYLRIVEKLRAARPGIAFTTDIIVGFPGETDEDFAATASLMREVEFDQAYLFKYSKRRDTPAATMPEQVSATVKEARHQELLTILNTIMLRRHRQLIGQTVEVLVEGRSAKKAERMFGRTRTNKGVVLTGNDELTGRLLPVTVQRVTVMTLYGEEAA
jgi:tRNA-2-methylthio-N6-dimethylallyladenosine synthase